MHSVHRKNNVSKSSSALIIVQPSSILISPRERPSISINVHQHESACINVHQRAPMFINVHQRSSTLINVTRQTMLLRSLKSGFNLIHNVSRSSKSVGLISLVSVSLWLMIWRLFSRIRIEILNTCFVGNCQCSNVKQCGAFLYSALYYSELQMWACFL